LSTVKQTEIDHILEDLFTVMPLLHRKLLRMDLGGVTGEFTRVHLGILGRLHMGSITASELAHDIKLPRPQISHVIDQLVTAGLVEREPDTKDRRVINLLLTEKGIAKFQEMKQKVNDNIKTELSVLTSKELQEMSEALETLGRIGKKL
jgi:DNA-binding MarR family transcriptional regulator